MALVYYEQGLKSLKMDIEIRQKLHSDDLTEEQFFMNPDNVISPELLNNIGVLRMEHAEQLKQSNTVESKNRQHDSFSAFK